AVRRGEESGKVGGGSGRNRGGWDVVGAGAAGALFELFQSVGVNVQSVNLAAIVHLSSQLQRLAAGSGAGVDDHFGRGVHQHSQKLASFILDLEKPLAEPLQSEGVRSVFQNQAQLV